MLSTEDDMQHRRQIENVVVLLECNGRNSDLGESVLEKLRELDAAGPHLHAGSQIQFGWSILTLRPEGEGLRVCEPDYLGDILQLKPTVDVTLDILRQQVPLLRAVGEDGVDARYDQELAANPEAFATDDVFLKRDAPEFSEDTGWFLGKLTDLETARPADDLESVHVYELLRRRPALMAILALPQGYLAIIRGETIAAVFDPNMKLRLGEYEF